MKADVLINRIITEAHVLIECTFNQTECTLPSQHLSNHGFTSTYTHIPLIAFSNRELYSHQQQPTQLLMNALCKAQISCISSDIILISFQ